MSSITKNLITAIGTEIQKPEIQNQIMTEIIDPAISGLTQKYMKYIIAFVFIQILIVVLLIYIIFLVRRRK